MAYELRHVRSPQDWRDLHRIRRSVLFTPERHAVEYDENHPDDRAHGNLPLLLIEDGRPVAVARLDVRREIAVVRLVAVTSGEQRRGYGKVLNALIDEEARRRGVKTLRVNAAPDAVGFYEKAGWQTADWDATELTGLASDCVQMSKDL